MGLREAPLYLPCSTHMTAVHALFHQPSPPFPCSYVTAIMGALPLARSIACLTTFNPASIMSSRVSTPAMTASLTALSSVAVAMGSFPLVEAVIASTGRSQGLILASSLPPVPAKIVSKIQVGQFIQMKDLLGDNIALVNQLDNLPANSLGGACSSLPRPQMREVSSALAWAGCFLTFAAVKMTDRATRDLLTYGRLVLWEAQRHSGPGWLEYDRIFRQHAALNPSTQWSELNPSLHASTILSRLWAMS